MTSMSRIERYGNWFDCLDRIKIKNGERLLVRFPNGTEETITACVRDDTTAAFAYAQISYHGVFTLVPLLGLEARRL
jgi:hypothetical protein